MWCCTASVASFGARADSTLATSKTPFDFENLVTLHIVEHAGEISSLVGAMGLKGSAWG